MSRDEIKAIARKSNGVLADLGSSIQWIESYVVNNRLYCVYIAPDEELIREHGRLGGFPCNVVSRVYNLLDPTTAET